MPLIKLTEDPADYQFEIELNGSVQVLTINIFALAHKTKDSDDPENPTVDEMVAAARSIATPPDVAAGLPDHEIFAKASAAGVMFANSGNVPEPSQT